ncbi:hypothetical protein MMC22_004360 [Lobaria immixta]|nr:hypothetical protein [Lobaria immixta]
MELQTSGERWLAGTAAAQVEKLLVLVKRKRAPEEDDPVRAIQRKYQIMRQRIDGVAAGSSVYTQRCRQEDPLSNYWPVQ